MTTTAASRADRPGFVEHRPVGHPAGHPRHADPVERKPVRPGRPARDGQRDEPLALSGPHRRLLVQRESKPEDFAKVARVIYNRLAENRTLEFDSTVNYPLDRIEVATTDGDRGQLTPWNTYVRAGLPATPICSPSQPALLAAEKPADGDWLYFVTIDLQGTTLFTRDYNEHLANIELARHNGVLDSAR